MITSDPSSPSSISTLESSVEFGTASTLLDRGPITGFLLLFPLSVILKDVQSGETSLLYDARQTILNLNTPVVKDLQAALLLSQISSEIVGEPLKQKDSMMQLMSFFPSWLVHSVDENKDGSFATYELTRSYAWLEASVKRSSQTEVHAGFGGFVGIWKSFTAFGNPLVAAMRDGSEEKGIWDLGEVEVFVEVWKLSIDLGEAKMAETRTTRNI
ncbi:Cycloartenol synthase [Platanthera guangdongensis]|uniref:Cycloartenol synthase n=1 Tax=Platanthera guangdongensis TaxID=2320717 RepID=A0ABR2LKD3_9ASPA